MTGEETSSSESGGFTMTDTKSAQTKKTSTRDKKEAIAKAMIDLMEKTGLPAWKCPWIFLSADMAYKGSTYNGVNAIITALARTAYGYKSRLWLTHTKIEGLNGKVWTPAKGKGKSKGRWVKTDSADSSSFAHIRKGTHGVPVIYWDWIVKKDDKGNPILDEEGNPETRPFLRTYIVHNADNIENFDPTPFEPERKKTGIDETSCREIEERLLASYTKHPKVVHGGDRACYFPTLDQISIPEYSQFTDVAEFASTLAHELSHSTGHSSRLKRNLSGWKGSDQYAFEELVAEFSAAMILGTLGIDTVPSAENNAAYLKSWLSHLKKDPVILFDAISAAKKASSMVLNETDETPEEEDTSEATPAEAV